MDLLEALFLSKLIMASWDEVAQETNTAGKGTETEWNNWRQDGKNKRSSKMREVGGFCISKTQAPRTHLKPGTGLCVWYVTGMLSGPCLSGPLYLWCNSYR